MASSAATEAVTLAQVSEELGVNLSESLLSALRLALTVQVGRHSRNVADRSGVTRSVLLWSICRLSKPVADVLSAAGLATRELEQLLDIVSVPPLDETATDTDTIVIEPELANAMRQQLHQRGEVSEVDVARALLKSTRTKTGVGLLGSRLHELGVDVEQGIKGLDELARRAVTPGSARVRDEQFSRSVNAVLADLGPSKLVTASQIAQALQLHHPGYGRGAFATVELRPDVGERRTTENWLRAALGCYNLDVVARTRHRGLDGSLTLLALAELDSALARDLDQGGFLDLLGDEVEVRPQHQGSDRTEWSADSPATVDLLGRENLAAALAERVRRLAYEGSRRPESFLVHVDGPWGAGKSTLFYFLRRELMAAKFLVVPVNAWREQRVGVQWWTLLNSLERQIAQEAKGSARIGVWAHRLFDRFRARWVPFVIAVLVLVGVGAAVLSGMDLTRGGELADSTLKLTSLASVVFAGLVASTRYLLPGSKKSAESLIENSENPMRQVGRLFARTLARAAPRPVVFLIDDLDRCDADYVVEFLEVVQTLVKDAPTFLEERRAHGDVQTPGPYGFIAADGRWIRSSYEQHFNAFGSTAAPGRPLGYLFLEKVFQLHVLLPVVTPAARQRYFTKLLTPSAALPDGGEEQKKLIQEADAAVIEATTERELLSAGRRARAIIDPEQRMRVLGMAAERFSERAIEDAASHELSRFVGLLDPNPRSMKLFVNTYGVLRSLRTLEEVFIATEPLALWTIIEIRWPVLADHLRSNPSTIEDWKAGGTVSGRCGLLFRDDAVIALLEDPGWGQLDAKLVRACGGVN